VYSHRGTVISAEKQRALDELCQQLFKRQELITSGKLQLIGLAAIKKRMGKRWAGLCQVVYDTTEDVIKAHIDKTDVFMRYHDDTYVIIFAHGTLAEGVAKAEQIAEDIRKRLFALDEEDLRRLEIKKAVSVFRADQLAGGSLLDAMDSFFGDLEDSDEENFVQPHYRPPPSADGDTPALTAQVGTAHYKPVPSVISAVVAAMPDLDLEYMPQWDVRRKALTIYLALARNPQYGGDLFESHVSLYRDGQDMQRLAVDLKILEDIKTELTAMSKDGRKFLIVCPVQYETLHTYDSYEVYKNLCETIPVSQRSFLSFLVMAPEKKLPQKDHYWFVKPLHAFGRYIFAEVPVSRETNLNMFRAIDIDGVGVRIPKNMTEHAIITYLNSFTSKARHCKIPCTFVLGVSRLSLVTSAVCAGFDYIAGSLIHDAIPIPEGAPRYGYEDLAASVLARVNR
jgi:GGDEF domain-containing protein